MRGLIIGKKIIELENRKLEIVNLKKELSDKMQFDKGDMSENSGMVALQQELNKLIIEEEEITSKIKKLNDIVDVDLKITDKFVCKDSIVKVDQNGEELLYIITTFTDLSKNSLSMINIESEFGNKILGLKVGDSFQIDDLNVSIKEIL